MSKMKDPSILIKYRVLGTTETKSLSINVFDNLPYWGKLMDVIGDKIKKETGLRDELFIIEYIDINKAISENKKILNVSKKKEKINHPKHYNVGKYEVIDVIEDWKLDFHLGNAVKYIARAKYKENEIDDLKKGEWYLDRKISNLCIVIEHLENAKIELQKRIEENE